MKTKMLQKIFVTATFAFALATAAFADGANGGDGCSVCPPLADRTTVLASTLVDSVGNLLESNTHWTCDNVYILDTRVYVPKDSVLHIHEGTIIKGRITADGFNSNALVVTRGGKLYAIGSADCPIIFTAEDDPVDGTYPVTSKERWGGVIILGYAYNNIIAGDIDNPENPSVPLALGNGVGYIEGLNWPDSRHHYGAIDTLADGTPVFVDDDNSGIVRYVSIRHGGSEIGTNNEINGLTLGSVGSGTTLEYIEIISNGDDGVEFFGGTVDIKHASIMYCEDDYIDWDQGYKGRGQYVLGVQLPPTTGDVVADYGDNGMECDGDDGFDANRPTNSAPVFSNVTLIGYGAGTGDKGLELKERTGGEISNSVIANFDKGVNFADATSQGVTLENNTFVNCANWVTGAGAPAGFYTNNDTVASVTGFDFEHLININLAGPVVNEVVNGFDAVADFGAVKDMNAIDSFFDVVTYRGAIAPGEKPWTSFTLHAALETDNNLASCPTDIDGNGQTDVDDFLEVAGQFNKSCGK